MEGRSGLCGERPAKSHLGDATRGLRQRHFRAQVCVYVADTRAMCMLVCVCACACACEDRGGRVPGLREGAAGLAGSVCTTRTHAPRGLVYDAHTTRSTLRKTVFYCALCPQCTLNSNPFLATPLLYPAQAMREAAKYAAKGKSEDRAGAIQVGGVAS
jgi:hypothetical protein